MLTLENVARALAGEIVGDEVRVPGPGHSAKDRSLCVKLDRAAPGGFIVNSFAGDDPIRCKDYVREKLGLPSWNESHDGNRLLRLMTTQMKAKRFCFRSCASLLRRFGNVALTARMGGTTQ